jgi:hypothetical protein
MKYLLVILAAVALVKAIEEKKPREEKKEEKKPEERGGLQWPMPDPSSEGDLMLHGAINFDRVEALHKAKVEDEADKMILDHGRQFLRRVAKWFDDNADMKILPVLCRDSRNLNSTINRWRIEIAKEAEALSVSSPIVQRDEPLPKDNKEDKPKDIKEDKPKDKIVEAPRANITNDNETIANETVPIAQHDSVPFNRTEASTERPVSNSTEHGNSSEPARPEERESFETRRSDFYRQVGSNFARLLLRQYRKEALKADENEYLARWVADEAVHFGALAIYCREGENVKEIRKQLAAILEEKP